MATDRIQQIDEDRRGEWAIGCVLALVFGGEPRRTAPNEQVDLVLASNGSAPFLVAEIRRRSFRRTDPFAHDAVLRASKLGALVRHPATVSLYVVALRCGSVYVAPARLLQRFLSRKAPEPFTCAGSAERADLCFRVDLHKRPFFRIQGDWLAWFQDLYGRPFDWSLDKTRRRFDGPVVPGAGFAADPEPLLGPEDL